MHLHQIQVRTRALLHELDNITPPAVHADLAAHRDSAIDLANQVLRESSGPVRLGILGEFSAGKTRLIEALLGFGGGLPVAEKPSTGNAVEFHCKMVPGLKATQFGQFHVDFVSYQEGIEFLDHVRRHAEPLLPTSMGELREKLHEIRPGQWDKWQAWAELVRENTSKYDLSDLAFEAHRFSRAFQACGGSVGGESFALDAPAAQAAMSLEEGAPGTGSRDRSLPPGPNPLREKPERITPAMMTGLFPLVRVVRAEVLLPPEIGVRLLGSGENPFVIVDCPGLGADGSSLRDEFLCLRELRSVETILIVVNSRRPGSNAASTLHDMMRDAWGGYIKDRILVAVGRFDQLPLESKGKHQRVAELAREAGPLAPNALLTELDDPLGKLLKNAEKPLPGGRLDRIALVSGNLGLWSLKQDCPDLQVGSASFVAEEFAASEQAKLQWNQQVWSALAKRLEKGSEADEPQADWLREFALDGGMARLKRTCQSHLAEHGLVNQLRKVEPTFQEVERLVTELKEALAERSARVSIPSSNPDAGPGLNLGDVGRRLYGIYQQILSDLQSRSVPPLVFRPKGQVVRTRLAEFLRDEAVERIGDWMEWKLLLDHVDPLHGPGLIKVAQAPSLNPNDVDEDDDEEAAALGLARTRAARSLSIPTRTDDFFKPFQETLLALENQAKVLCEEAIALLLEDQAQQVRSILGEDRAAVADAVGSSHVKGQLATVYPDDGDQDRIAAALRIALDPTPLKSFLVKRCLNPRTDVPRPEPRDLFPLALTSADGKRIGRVFHWDPLIAARYGSEISHGRHQIFVLRCRQALEESASFHLKRVVEGYRRAIAEQLTKNYGKLSENLNELADKLR
jgi:hypothetical protein